MKKIRIFGAGEAGAVALHVMGLENVDAFCDNNASLHGKSRFGKRIISPQNLIEQRHDYIILIAANDKNYMVKYTTYHLFLQAMRFHFTIRSGYG